MHVPYKQPLVLQHSATGHNLSILPRADVYTDFGKVLQMIDPLITIIYMGVCVCVCFFKKAYVYMLARQEKGET